MKSRLVTLVSINACIWPGVFGAYAVWSERYDQILIYLAAGAVFGGVVLLLIASGLFLAAVGKASQPNGHRIDDGSLSPRKIAIAALILMAIGVTGLMSESLFGRV